MCVLAMACWALRPAWPTTWALALACLGAALPASVSTSGGAADRLTLAFLLLMTAATIGMVRAHRAEEVAAEDGVGDSAT